MREPILKHGLTALKAAEAEAKAETEAAKIDAVVKEPVVKESVDINPIENQVG